MKHHYKITLFFIFGILNLSRVFTQDLISYVPQSIDEQVILEEAEKSQETSIKRLLLKGHPSSVFQFELTILLDDLQGRLEFKERESRSSDRELYLKLRRISTRDYKELSNHLNEFYPVYLEELLAYRAKLERERIERERNEREARLRREKKFAEERRIAEEARLAEEQQIAEEARLAEEQRIKEEAKLAEERRIAEEARLAEEQRIAEGIRARNNLNLALVLILILFLGSVSFYLIRELKPSGSLHSILVRYLDLRAQSSDKSKAELNDIIVKHDLLISELEKKLVEKNSKLHDTNNLLQARERKISSN